MFALTIDQTSNVFGGISDGDPGSGLGYYATPSQTQTNVETNEKADADVMDAVGNFFAGVWAGL
jgi:hypothetical protein